MQVQSAQAAQTVRVGIMSGEDEDVWRVVAANAAQHGIDVKVSTSSDYTQSNEALTEHDLDANAFQHKPCLDAQVAARHYAIVPVGFTYVQPIGLYSRKHASVSALPTGASIGVPNDPSNEGRALLLLQSQGLITLRSGVGLLPTARDIESNPNQLKIKELDAGIVGRATGDLDADQWAPAGSTSGETDFRPTLQGIGREPPHPAPALVSRLQGVLPCTRKP